MIREGCYWGIAACDATHLGAGFRAKVHGFVDEGTIGGTKVPIYFLFFLFYCFVVDLFRYYGGGKLNSICPSTAGTCENSDRSG